MIQTMFPVGAVTHLLFARAGTNKITDLGRVFLQAFANIDRRHAHSLIKCRAAAGEWGVSARHWQTRSRDDPAGRRRVDYRRLQLSSVILKRREPHVD